MFDCKEYGCASCPPNIPAVEDCRSFFRQYKNAVVFYFEKILDDPADHREWAEQINSKLLFLFCLLQIPTEALRIDEAQDG